MDNVFLTSTGFGLTSSSANYLANIAQEVIREKKTILDNVSFLNTRIITPLCPEGLEYEHANFDLDAMSGIINEIGLINTFCAWMREGIKAKDEELKKVSITSFNDWAEKMNIVVPQEPVVESFTSEDALAKLSIGERLRMLRAEAVASAFGKFVHPDMPLSDARQQLHYRKLKPAEKSGNGQDLTLTVYTPAIDSAVVDKKFLELQNEQRQAEKELNSFKFEQQKQYAETVSDNKRRYVAEQKEYLAKMNVLHAMYETYITEERERVNGLKITVPEALMDTYKYLNGLGK